LIHADEKLHSDAIKMFQKYVIKASTVIDIGAGAGAFSLRLHDNGYIVTALDVSSNEWSLNQIEFLVLDINKGISKSVNRIFDSACCLEVIEHIENPWELLRDIRRLVKDEGYLILSTPNITSFWSRMYFLRKGYFHQFMPYDVEYGHINPITTHELKLIARNTGWEVCEIIPSGYLPIFDFSEFKLKLIFSNILRWLFYILSSGFKKGWCFMAVLRKISDGNFILPKSGKYYTI
jgi:2-polyprenyl-3-methyl-5-hydroxy-6-metoxy-1,4-benzoquinol methylase